MTAKLKHSDIPVPETMQDLPLTERGYFKPWFVKGDDFRVVDNRKAAFAVTKKNCWVCGKPFLEQKYAMVCSPISAMFRIFKEPPCHPACAEYALQVCPFLLYPNAKRREVGMPEENTLESVNQNLEVKIDGENPGEYYLVLVSDFVFDEARQVMTCHEADIVERQHWVEGTRQAEVPSPIVPFDDLPEDIQRQLKDQQKTC